MFDETTAIDRKKLAGRNIYVFSDLHSGDGSARDNFKFGNGEPAFRECVTAVRREDEDAAIVILGDFFEFWQSPFAGVVRNNLALMDFLADAGALYVLGNHDNDLLAFLDRSMPRLLNHPFFDGMGTGVLLEDHGASRIGLVHGHEVDPINSSPVPTVGRALSILAGIVEDGVGKPFFDKTTSVEDALERTGEMCLRGLEILWQATKTGAPIDFGSARTPASSPGLARKAIQDWDRERQNGRFDVLVCGHTHRPGHAKDSAGKVWYYNSGCWAKAPNTYLRIDKAGAIEIFEWNEGKAERCTTELSY